MEAVAEEGTQAPGAPGENGGCHLGGEAGVAWWLSWVAVGGTAQENCHAVVFTLVLLPPEGPRL